MGYPDVWNTLVVTVGGIGIKPGIVNGKSEEREYLNLTISVDHDVVDGAVAASFAFSLRERIESADGLSCLRTRAQNEAAVDASNSVLAPAES